MEDKMLVELDQKNNDAVGVACALALALGADDNESDLESAALLVYNTLKDCASIIQSLRETH